MLLLWKLLCLLYQLLSIEDPVYLPYVELRRICFLPSIRAQMCVDIFFEWFRLRVNHTWKLMPRWPVFYLRDLNVPRTFLFLFCFIIQSELYWLWVIDSSVTLMWQWLKTYNIILFVVVKVYTEILLLGYQYTIRTDCVVLWQISAPCYNPLILDIFLRTLDKDLKRNFIQCLRFFESYVEIVTNDASKILNKESRLSKIKVRSSQKNVTISNVELEIS